jgi:hypothetical protein
MKNSYIVKPAVQGTNENEIRIAKKKASKIMNGEIALIFSDTNNKIYCSADNGQWSETFLIKDYSS